LQELVDQGNVRIALLGEQESARVRVGMKGLRSGKALFGRLSNK
jgi:hypothetical protein